MIMLWVALLVAHQVYALTPVISVRLGEPVTFTCDLPNAEITRREVHWYRQSAGDTMKLVVILRKSTKPEFSKGFPESRMKVDDDNSFSNLTILRTIEEDEGMYQCAVIEWMTIPVWSGTYLLIKGNSQRTSNYTVVQWLTASDPVRPGDSVTLQCSLLSDSENKTCPGDHSVYWFRAGSEKSHPEIIHTDGNHQCEKRSDTVKSCVYGFSKTISSSDAGTYYCAVATCGQILFGNGTKLHIEQRVNSQCIGLVISLVCLAISVTGNIIFIICYRRPRPACAEFKAIENASLQVRHESLSQSVHNIAESEHDLNYAALRFSGAKATRGRKKKELKAEESVYAQVKCSTQPIKCTTFSDLTIISPPSLTEIPKTASTRDKVKMMMLWVTLLLLHRGYSLVPVNTVQLGESVTFTCANKELNTKEVHWYRQSAGDTMKLILTFWQTKIEHGPEFSESRMKANLDNSFSNLTILRTIGDDEGMYHCGVAEWIKTEWSGTYLLVKGNSQRTSNYTVVQWSTASDPVRPGDSVTLQCSLLSDSENKKCPGDHSVYWFRAGSEKSHPEIIHTDGNHQCEKRSDTVKSCVYGVSKTISSSDAGTYYCAVATCGGILFGNGTKLDIVFSEREQVYFKCIALIISLVCLAISVTGNIIFICYRTPRAVCAQFKGREGASSPARADNPSQIDDIAKREQDLNYAALHFSGRKATRGRKKQELKTEESVYAHVKIST
ncbi:uncharacterized protein [Channa argus]|uniref:uncharacterized protein n=1 Tax=Channa argus TaxID=215402 RepID=UPI003522D2AB